MPVTVFDVANYFLRVVDRESGGGITHLKLQKLVYYAQAWHLVFTGQPLFDERIEAWVHGPVCPMLFNHYSTLGFQNIPEPAEPPAEFTTEQTETLEAVWQAYGNYDGKYLEELTHQEPPWREARKGLAPGVHCTDEISRDSMKAFYSTMQTNA